MDEHALVTGTPWWIPCDVDADDGEGEMELMGNDA